MLFTKNEVIQDPRVKRTRSLLINALGELLYEKNFESITVNQITERATLNRVTFYAHFQDKYELLETATGEMVRQQINSALPQRNPFSEEKLASLLKLVCSFLTDFVGHCPPPHGQLESLIEKQIKTALYDVILSWLRSVPTNGSANAEQVATVSAWSMYGATSQWSQKNKREPIDEFIRQVLPLIMSNLQKLNKSSKKYKTRTSQAPGSSGTYALLRQLQLSY